MYPPDLPTIEVLRTRMQAIATLDAILSEDWNSRYYSFNAEWDRNEMMGSMRDGEGDEWFCFFATKSAIILGVASEAPMARPGHPWTGIYEGVPGHLRFILEEPSFRQKDKTFCFWRTKSDATWQHGPIKPPAGEDPDGSKALLRILNGEPQTYADWAKDYHEEDVATDAIAAVYAHEPMTKELAARIAAQRSYEDLLEDLEEIGYPVA